MNWFSEFHVYKSEINGDIVARRNLGVWRVTVNNCGQTTDYTRAMWQSAIRRVSSLRSDLYISNVLMLGLGAAGEVGTLHKQFPNCEITAIEYDPKMVELAKFLQLYKPFPFPTLLLGDAKIAVQNIEKKFDLIVFDMFLGPEPSPLAKDLKFISALKERLASGGALLINVNTRPEYLDASAKLFSKSVIWKYRFNNIGAFW